MVRVMMTGPQHGAAPIADFDATRQPAAEKAACMFDAA
jgi:hypothetical protein